MAGQRRDEGTGRSPDHVLLDELRGMLDRVDPAPAWLLELARLSHGLRTVDLEVAELVADSQVDRPAVAVRATAAPSEPRLLTFEAEGLLIDLQVTQGERGPELSGQIVPAAPATVELRQPGRAVRTVRADAHGRFTTAAAPGSPFSLVVSSAGRRIAAPWVIDEAVGLADEDA